MKKLLFLLIAGSLFFTSCRKADQPAPPQTTNATKDELLKDSVFLYSREVYLWNDLIPAYDVFKPRQYATGTSEVETAQNVMNAIKKLQPLDRFSMVLTPEQHSGMQTGDGSDYGFFVKGAILNGEVRWFLTYVYDQSPAGKAGVQRGWYLNKVNGATLGNDDASIAALNNLLFGNLSTAALEFVKHDGTPVTLNLTRAVYTANSVLHRSVINSGGKKIGYLVFNQFFGAPSRTELTQAFNFFQTEGITELIVDLRNNRGGSTETQDFLANHIAPSSANGKVMYQYIFNSTLQNNKHELIRKRLGYGNAFTAAGNTELFEKRGSLELSKVVFITTSSSASASELLINNLKPYMDVKIVGSTTYGKPDGFFGIPVYNVYIYPVSFKTANSRGEGDYFTGMVPDHAVADGVNRNWGDLSEPSLAAAVKYITTGSYARMSAEAEALQRGLKETETINKKLDKKFIGMFPERD